MKEKNAGRPQSIFQRIEGMKTPCEFSFSKIWTHTHTEFDWRETETQIVWHVEQTNLHDQIPDRSRPPGDLSGSPHQFFPAEFWPSGFPFRWDCVIVYFV